ncbi:MAG: hypothetical protein JSV08_01020, partial [Acidobacteriota bacterium]
VIRTVRKNRGLPEEPPKQGFRAETRGERPFVSKGNAFLHETPRFQSEIDVNGLRYFAQGNKEKPDFEILSVQFEQGGVSQTVFGKGRLEEHAPGLLQGETRDGVTSYARNRGEGGIEIYWTIDEPIGPEASALSVRLAIRAAGEPREHPEGLVFPARQEEGQITLSNVTVVDAAGRRERVRPSLATGSEVLFEVQHEFLENAQYPVLIDPTVGPEFPVGPSPVIEPAALNQTHPSVASNGTDYFVAWVSKVSLSCYQIYGARVSADGIVLNPSGIAIASSCLSEAPSVASNGIDYFVVWHEPGGDFTQDIYGKRVVPCCTSQITISSATGNQLYPSIASDGTDYFVAWQDYRNGLSDIYGARMTSGGSVLDPAGIAVSTAGDNQERPSATSNGTDYFVAWHDWRNSAITGYDIYGARVRASDGLLLDGPPDTGGIAVSTAADDQYYPSAASNGTDYFVAWQDYRSGADYDIYGTRVTSTGTVLDPTPTDIAVSTAADNQRYPSVASNGTDYFIAWTDYRSGTEYDVYGARVTSAGTVLDSTGIAVSTAAFDQYNPSAASNGTGYFVAWADYRSGVDSDIYGGRVTSAGAVLDAEGILISKETSVQGNPAVASNGTDYFVVWVGDPVINDYNIYGSRVSSSGTVLDPSGIAICTNTNYQDTPSVASNGTDYLAVWKDDRNSATTYDDIYGARVQASDGALLDGPPDSGGILIGALGDYDDQPSVASNGTGYLVVWRDWEIYGTRVTSGGVVLDNPPVQVTTDPYADYPEVASNGTDYLIVWESFFSFSDDDVYASRVKADGTDLDPSDIAVAAVFGIDESAPSVASNGTDYFVAWHDERNGAANDDIYGTRVASDGTVLDISGIAVSTAAGNQRSPSVASNGTDYFIVWEDYQSGGDDDIYGARVASDGTVLDAAGILIQQSLYDDSDHAVAYSACGKYLIAYRRFYEDPSYVSYTIMARTVEDDIPSAGEVSAPGSGRPLTVERASGQVKLFWAGLPSDCAGVIQYNIYEGDLDSLPPYNHSSLVCWTAGTDEGGGYLSGIITPGFANAYYLVTECDMATEGTSGYDSDAVERNPLLNTCGPHP